MTHNPSRRLFLASLAAPIALPDMPSPRRQFLLLDRRNVERTENAVLRVCRAEKDPHNPLFSQDKPWEVRYDNLYPNVRRDPNGSYQCWYSPFIVDEAVRNTARNERVRVPYKPLKRQMGLCYAESSDGIAWTKPELGLIDFDGSRRNNLVLRGPHGSGVYFDAHETDPARMYKLLYEEHGICGAFSPDGKLWTHAVRFSGIDAVGDTHNNAIWAASLNRFVGITRLWDRPAKQRLVARTESPDFLNWTKAVEIMRADPKSVDSQTYSMPIFEYEGVFLGLVAMFHVPTDSVQTELAWSPDTLHWERIDEGNPVVARGPTGSVDSGCVYAAAPVRVDEEIRIYYGGSDGPHSGWRDGYFCLARLQSGRFAGFESTASGSIAKIVTTPVRVTSSDLRINVNAQHGQVRVAVLERAGNSDLPLDRAEPIRADLLDGLCRWKNSGLRSLVGKDVQFLFELRGARIYGFRFA